MMHEQQAAGLTSELLVAAYLADQGHEVLFPLRPDARVDLVYLTPAAVRVQVKSASWSKSGPFQYEQFRLIGRRKALSRGHLPYTAEEIDELWAVGTHLWKFPVSALHGQTSICLGSNNPASHPHSKLYNPDDYIEVRGSLAAPFRRLLSRAA